MQLNARHLMHTFLKAIAAIAISLSAAPARADTLFDNTSGSIIAGWGFFNPNAAWGDEITLANEATVTSFSFDVGDVYAGYEQGSLTLAFYQVDAGADGVLQTGDDRIGAFIDSYSQSVNLTANSPVSLSGFSILVPANFVYTVTNVGNLSYSVEATQDAASAGSASNDNIWVNFSGGLPVGTASSTDYASYFGNNQVQLAGATVVPEPRVAYLILASGLLLLFRVRKSRR